MSQGSALPIAKLPDELLSMVLKQVRYNSSPSSFVACLLCCKRWQDISLHLLYRDIVLTNPKLEAFVTGFPRTYGHFVRSLTITLDPETANEDLPGPELDSDADCEAQLHMMEHGNSKANLLWRWLREVPAIIGSMTKMTSFSLTVSNWNPPLDAWAPVIGFWIPRPILFSIVERLPETCVSLEIDFKGYDSFEPRSVHPCDALRAIIPRLRHLRLRLNSLCPAIFGTGFTVGCPIRDGPGFKPIAAPLLKTLVLNYVMCHSGPTHLCGTLEDRPYDLRPDTDEARNVLVDSLRSLFTSSGCPAIERLWMLDVQRHVNTDEGAYATYGRRDMVRNKTWAIPCRSIRGVERDSVLTRTPKGQEFLSYQWAVEALAEGEAWKETLGGARFPAEVLRAMEHSQMTGQYSEKKLPISSKQAYLSRFPKRTCALWYNEKLTGMRLLDAVERDGLADRLPVKEKTPPGWTRRAQDSGRLSPENPATAPQPSTT
ncbi:MAG: hypothetical protein M1816_005665 [Peltula sp. TS41687]|nr:MAG: hypothetical protein M1816_005665 [Peltula sp. TS41687]